MTKDEYAEYLKSEHWQRVRGWVLVFWDYRCALCFAPDSLHVHHRSYLRLWREKLTDCIVLCDGCHKKFHDVLVPGNEPISILDFPPAIIDQIRNGVRL